MSINDLCKGGLYRRCDSDEIFICIRLVSKSVRLHDGVSQRLEAWQVMTSAGALKTIWMWDGNFKRLEGDNV